jgi:hypothetical protein
MPRLDRIQLAANETVTADRFDRLQTNIERALREVLDEVAENFVEVVDVTGSGSAIQIRCDGIIVGAKRLASYDASALIEGALAYVASVNSIFTLKATALTPDNIAVVTAFAKPGYQWHRLLQRNLTYEAVTTWYVDPANVAANDENFGSTAGSPLRTYAELGRRLWGAFLTHNVAVNAVSGAPNTDILDLQNVATDTFRAITITGIPTVIDGGRTISTPRNPASSSANDHYEITDATATFGPWIQTYLLHRTSGTQAWFWAYKDLGAGKLHTSPPLNAGAALQTFANGDTYEVLSLPTFADVIATGGSSKLSVTLQFVKVLGALGFERTTTAPSAVALDRCLLAPSTNAISISGTVNLSIAVTNCCIPAAVTSAQIQGRASISGGLFAGNGTTSTLALSNGYVLGGGIVTLGGRAFQIIHPFLAEDLTFNVYDWAGAGAAIVCSRESQIKIDSIGGERNTGPLVSVDLYSHATSVNSFATWNSAITTNPNPYIVVATTYSGAQLGAATNQVATRLTGIVDLAGVWANHLSGVGINPSVIGLQETGGPTSLLYAAIPDTGYLRRVGTTVVGQTTIPASVITGLFYQTIQNGGSAVTQQPIWNASTGLTAVNNGGATRTDVTVNLSTGIAGGQSAIGGTGASENLTLSSTTNGTKGEVIFGSTTGMVFNENTNVLSVGIASANVATSAHFKRTDANGNNVYVENTSSGTGAYMGLTIGNNDTIFTGPYFGFWQTGASFSTVGFATASSAWFQLGGGSGNMWFDLHQSSGDFVFSSTTSNTERFRITNGGATRHDNMPSITYSSGGAVTPSNPTVVEWSITPPSTASTSGPNALHQWDSVTLTFTGTTTVDAIQYVRFNGFTITDASALTVTKAATVAIAGPPISAGSVTITTPLALDVETGVVRVADTLIVGTTSSVAGQRLRVLGTKTLASATSLTFDPVYVDCGTLTLTGTTHVTTGRGLDGVYVKGPTITDSSAVTVDLAATVYIDSAPGSAGSVTLTKSYALYVTNGDSFFDTGSNVSIYSLTVRSAMTTPDIQVPAGGGVLHVTSTAIGFFGVGTTAQVVGGPATAGATYGGTEQTMLNTAYSALRTYGLLS